METVKLNDPTLPVEHPNGQTYVLADPVEFIVGLTRAGLLDPTGKPVEGVENLSALRDKTREVFGFPTLTYPQLLQILEAIKAFVEAFQKKTPLTPTSPNATDSSPRKMPVG